MDSIGFGGIWHTGEPVSEAETFDHFKLQTGTICSGSLISARHKTRTPQGLFILSRAEQDEDELRLYGLFIATGATEVLIAHRGFGATFAYSLSLAW